MHNNYAERHSYMCACTWYVFCLIALYLEHLRWCFSVGLIRFVVWCDYFPQFNLFSWCCDN